jgi:ADP-ribosylglycohydrolase
MNATCQGSVPQAIRAFLEGNTFEECIRLAVSLGGDSDTIACITGSIAEAYYTIPFWIKKKVIDMLKPKELLYPSYIMFSKSFINNV